MGLVISVFVAMAHNSDLYKRSLEDLQSFHAVICYVCCILWSIGENLNRNSIQTFWFLTRILTTSDHLFP